MKNTSLTTIAATATLLAAGIAQAAPALIPQPTKMTTGAGAFTLKADTVLVADNAPEKAEAQKFIAYIAPATGFTPRIVEKAPKSNSIEFDINAAASTNAEGYTLSVAPDKVKVSAPQSAGLFYGIQTLRQLLPVSVYAPTKQNGVTWQMPAVQIEDAPRFVYRGMHLDTGRHFFPVADVKKYIDEIALHKFNTFHWHLTEDQGWRLAIKKYPKLTEIGSKRAESGREDDWQKGDGVPYGGFYTQDEAREIVAYAMARHINVVPEIEMPGHASAAIASYPELGNTDVPGYKPRVEFTWGVYPHIFAPKEETFAFLEDVLTEVMDIFPSKYIHIGGDEAPKTQWNQSAFAQEVIKKNGLKDSHELQSYFIQRIEKFLNANGRTIIGWDEILEGGLAPNAVVMSWRGENGAVEAAKQDHPVIMASNSAYYLDYRNDNTPGFPGAVLPLRRVYNFDPGASIPADKRHWLLGIQGQLWTEHIENFPKLERMAWPRASAIAETAWSQNTDKDFANFNTRLQTHVQRLKAMGVNFFPLEEVKVPAGTWKSGGVGENFVTKTWDVTPQITKAGNVEAKFQYTGGTHRLDIAWAELLQNGTVVARDEHSGMTGGATKDNVYSFALPTYTAGTKYELRANVRSDGGNDSNGEIYLSVK